MSEEKILKPEQNYGPGNVLRAKREEYEWSVDAVAEALHLSTGSVKAIEADRYDDLPGATYVMGYWRSYARLLGIDIEETIEANKQNLNIVTAEASGMDINRAFGHQKKGGAGKWLLFLILLGVFAYFAWQPPKLFGLLDQYNLPGASNPVMPVDESTEPETKAEVSEPVNDPEAQVLRSVKKMPAPQVSDAQAGATDSSDANSAGSGLILQPVKSGAASEPVETDSNAPATSASPAMKEESTDTNVALAKQETVTFKLSKATWLDVRDKSRKSLYKATGEANSEVEVSGVPPFYILIQPPDGASVFYQGKEMPFSAHENGLYARFKLDKTLESL